MPESTIEDVPDADTVLLDAPAAGIEPEAVRRALAHVLESEELRSSPQLSNILRFVVEATLIGRRDAIKGYTIAVEALGRDPSFDPQADPIVRVEATRLRRALERYYAGAGAGDDIEIMVPRGSYVPHFLSRRDAGPGSVMPEIVDGDRPADIDGAPIPAMPLTPPADRWSAGRLVGALALAAFYAILSYARLEVFKMLLSSFFPLLVLILAVLGSIVFGLATPTEAAAVGAFGGFVLAAAYRQLTFGVVKESVFLTAKTSAMVCWLFVGSAIFSAAFALLGGQELVEQWVLGMNLTKIQFLVLSQVIIFILGWPLEWTEIIVIFMPIFIPLLDNFGVDPLFFGLLVALNLQTAFLSPPVAMSAFYLKGVAPKHVTLNQIFAGMLPFMGIQVLAIVLLYMFPGIGLWLPQVLYK